MKTEFYLHTAYRLSEMPVPNCFLKLDEHFDLHLEPRIPREGGTHVALLLAESICARMADVEMYAYLIDDTRRRQRIGGLLVQLGVNRLLAGPQPLFRPGITLVEVRLGLAAAAEQHKCDDHGPHQ